MKNMMAALALLTACTGAGAEISVRDDKGSQVVLQRPAQRVVTLAPHATELVFAAGGGARIVGTVKYSEYPPAAKDIPRIGDNRLVDLERLVAAKPDLIVVWRHNAAERQLEQLRALGIPLFYSEPRKLAEIPDNIERLARLLGTEREAAQVVRDFRREHERLAARYTKPPVVRVFYQLWHKPMYTLNGKHISSDVIRLCGGENIFANLPLPAPVVSTEAVLLEKPDAIVASTGDRHFPEGLDHWKSFATLPAVRNGFVFGVDTDLINRPGMRILEGAEQVCMHLERVREHLGRKR